MGNAARRWHANRDVRAVAGVVVTSTPAENDAGCSWATRGCTASWLMGRGQLMMWRVWAVAGMEHCQGSGGCGGGLHHRGITSSGHS